LNSVPSVIVTGDAGGGIGYSSIRVRGTDASRINITANGVPINDSESHNVYWVNMPDFVSSVRDIQIQRGAGTSTNGAGAFGASINMLSDAPSLDSYAQVVASYGSYNANRQTVKVGSGLFGGHWGLGRVGSVRRSLEHRRTFQPHWQRRIYRPCILQTLELSGATGLSRRQYSAATVGLRG